MEVAVLGLIYLFTILIPINFLALLAMKRERNKMRRILIGLWKVYGRK